ncbi:MAG: GreA/GreB family elongation factor [Pirellulales bacterium]|nr:GreA/GreB family elongation factor [Pirellulales bacterium]
MKRAAFVTHDDRRRLGTMLETLRAGGAERMDYLDALDTRISEARRICPTEAPDDLVTMNATVVLRDVKSREKETYKLVYPSQADGRRRRVSVLAPIGTAVLGHRVGDVVEVQTPSGRRRIRIESIRYQPERAGHYHL